MRGGLLVCGATSGAGKSTVVAGLGRLLARRGIHVAPFKAQNMSNHSAVTADGGEVGRAQAMQAAACGVEVERAMNPVLLKPSSERGSHVVIDGTEVGTTDGGSWGDRTRDLRTTVLAALESLRRRFDVVVAEGAGGAAEINLLERDIVNLPLALAAGLRALLVVDIERGGAFAAAHGSLDLLPASLRATVDGIVFNRFRGDVGLLDPGIDELERRSGVPVLGVLPHLGPEPLLGVEDGLDVGAAPADTRSMDPLRVAVVRFPHLANPSDLDPLVVEPDVEVADGRPWVRFDDEHGSTPDGAVDATGRIRGTSLHGLFDTDAFRAALLTDLARRRRKEVQPSDVTFADRVAAQHDRLADWLEADLDLARVLASIEAAAPPGSGPGWL